MNQLELENQQELHDLNYNDKMLRVLNSGLLADCSFAVGTARQEIFAHKFVLALASPVFEKMFYSQHEFVETQSSHKVPLEDINAEEFVTFIRHVYTMECDTFLAEDSVAQLKRSYFLADRFLVDELKDKLYSDMLKRLKQPKYFHTISVFEFAYEIKDDKLMDECIEVLQKAGYMEDDMLKVIECNNFSASAFLVLLQKTKNILSEQKRFELLDSYAKLNNMYQKIESGSADKTVKGCRKGTNFTKW